MRILNYRAPGLKEDELYAEEFLDIDLNLQNSANKIFLIFLRSKLYISVGGLAFSDIIYAGDLLVGGESSRAGYILEADQDYMLPRSMEIRHDVLTESLPRTLIKQLDLYSAQVAGHQLDLFSHIATYADGTYCGGHDKAREAKLLFYCDPNETEEYVIVGGAETDYCEYMFKIKTRYLCPAGRRLARASTQIQ